MLSTNVTSAGLGFASPNPYRRVSSQARSVEAVRDDPGAVDRPAAEPGRAAPQWEERRAGPGHQRRQAEFGLVHQAGRGGHEHDAGDPLAEPLRVLQQDRAEPTGGVQRAEGVNEPVPALVQRFGGQVLRVQVAAVAELGADGFLQIGPQRVREAGVSCQQRPWWRKS